MEGREGEKKPENIEPIFYVLHHHNEKEEKETYVCMWNERIFAVAAAASATTTTTAAVAERARARARAREGKQM